MRSVGVIVAVFLASVASWAVDWPQYQADAARSGYTAQALPAEMQLVWKREANHAPQPAWIGRRFAQSRMKFDWVYSVVVADGTAYFGSSADHKVYALDANTGREKWSFFTDGPVRFAPAVWKDRVFAVSDDGHLYCLSAKDGTLIWKVNGGPEIDRVLGNGRIVSRWVARGGLAVLDDTVYFGAGIWPTDGVYICAVDAASGKVIWCNNNAGPLEIDQPHMGAHSRGGVIAQGYFAATEENVFVMTGRSVPAVFDRMTGRLRYFHLSRYGGKTPWGVGGGDVVATDDVFINAGFVFDVPSGLRYHQIGQRNWWVPWEKDGKRYHGEFLVGERQFMTITPGQFIRSEGKTISGSTLTQTTYIDKHRDSDTAFATERLEVLGMTDSKHHAERIDNAPMLEDQWSIETPADIQAIIIAGSTAAIASGNEVSIVDLTAKAITWTASLDSKALSLAAANGKLYASCESGAIYCFGQKTGANDFEVIRPARKTSPYPKNDGISKAVEQIIEKSGITSGYCLDLGCGDGALSYELAKHTDLIIVAVDSDPKNVAEARRKLDQAGLYGTRVTVLQADLGDTHLPDYFANLIVSRNEKAVKSEIARLQRPYGGVACIGKKLDVRGPLEGGGSWTHGLADPGNTMNSNDTIAKGPLGILWFRDEQLATIDRHGKNPAPLFYEGVLIIEGIDGIDGIDAYNGRVIWHYSDPGLLSAYFGGTGVGATQIGTTFCADDGIVYARKDDYAIMLDTFTGEKLGKFTAPRHPDGKERSWTYLAVEKGILYGALANEEHTVTAVHGDGGADKQVPMDRHFTESSFLFAMDARTGKVKWTFAPKESIRTNSIAVGNRRIFFIDRPVAEMDKLFKDVATEMRRGGEPLPVHPTGKLYAIDGQTGKIIWSDDDDIFGTTLVLSAKYDLLLMTFNKVGRAIQSDAINDGVVCYNAKNGERKWEGKALGKQRPVVNDRTLYSPPFAFDLITGEQVTVNIDGKELPWTFDGRTSGCGPLGGSANLLMGRSGAMGYYDLVQDSGIMETFGGIRAGCWLNMIAVGGLVLAPDDTVACRCSYQNQATIALKEYGFRPPTIAVAKGQEDFGHNANTNETWFEDSIEIVMSHPDDDIVIRYTLDDSYPNGDSQAYSKAITLDETTRVRATAFRNGREVAVRDVTMFYKGKPDNPGRSETTAKFVDTEQKERRAR